MLYFSAVPAIDQDILNQAYQLLSLQRNDLAILMDLKIEVVYCNGDIIKDYKKQYYGLNEETDVLTFDWREEYLDSKISSTSEYYDDIYQAQILINIDLVQENAKVFKTSIESEKVVLLVHGLLHLAYGDHSDKHKKDLFEVVTHDIIRLMNLKYRSIWPREKR